MENAYAMTTNQSLPFFSHAISQIATKNDRGRLPAILSGKIDCITATPTPATNQQLIE
jgi:hypothetical protein